MILYLSVTRYLNSLQWLNLWSTGFLRFGKFPLYALEYLQRIECLEVHQLSFIGETPDASLGGIQVAMPHEVLACPMDLVLHSRLSVLVERFLL